MTRTTVGLMKMKRLFPLSRLSGREVRIFFSVGKAATVQTKSRTMTRKVMKMLSMVVSKGVTVHQRPCPQPLAMGTKKRELVIEPGAVDNLHSTVVASVHGITTVSTLSRQSSVECRLGSVRGFERMGPA